MKRSIPEISVKSFLPVYYHHCTETIAIRDLGGNTICTVPREYIEEHVKVFGESLLIHLRNPAWKIRGYESAVGREEWYDIHSDIHKDSVISYAKKLKNQNSNIILGLREIVETEIEI